MAGEAYTKRYAGGFADGSGGGTPVDSTFLNAVEAALLRLLGEDPAADEVGVWVPASNRFVFQKITNAQIDAAAAIDKSKLGPLNIVNADVSASAAIAKSKLAALNIVNADVASGAAIAQSKLASAEVAYNALTANAGPTAVTSTGNGDGLFTFGNVTTEAVKYYFEMVGLLGVSAAANTIYFRLHEGSIASPGALIEEFEVQLSTTAVKLSFFLRAPFVPAAGTREYHVRWRSSDASSWTLHNSINPLVARIVRA